MEKLRDLRVEPVEIEGVGVEEAGDRPGVGDVRREGQVVPERIAAVDPAIEGKQRGARPLRGDDQRENDPGSQLDPADCRRLAQVGLLALPPPRHPRAGAVQHRLEAKRASADDQRGHHEQDALEQAEQPKQLREDHEDADREHGVGQQRGGAGPTG